MPFCYAWIKTNLGPEILEKEDGAAAFYCAAVAHRLRRRSIATKMRHRTAEDIVFLSRCTGCLKVSKLRRMKFDCWIRLHSLGGMSSEKSFHYRMSNPLMAPLLTRKPFITKKQLSFHLHQSWIKCLSAGSGCGQCNRWATIGQVFWQFCPCKIWNTWRRRHTQGVCILGQQGNI